MVEKRLSLLPFLALGVSFGSTRKRRRRLQSAVRVRWPSDKVEIARLTPSSPSSGDLDEGHSSRRSRRRRLSDYVSARLHYTAGIQRGPEVIERVSSPLIRSSTHPIGKMGRGGHQSMLRAIFGKNIWREAHAALTPIETFRLFGGVLSR